MTVDSFSAPAVEDAVAGPTLYFHPEARDWVQRWADRFRLLERLEPPRQPDAPLLWAARDHLELRIGGSPDSARRAPGSTRQQGAWVTEAEVRRRVRQTPELVRACGLKPGMRVLDAMAGWGLDGLVLAAHGAIVTMVEREPLMQTLQEDLIRRMGFSTVCSTLGDGFGRLDDERGFDLVYLDPMFPERGKQALPGKRMQYLSALAEVPADERPLREWVERAIAIAGRRVVVKRRLHDIPAVRPDWQILGRSIRYDVYRGAGLSAPAEPRSGSPDR